MKYKNFDAKVKYSLADKLFYGDIALDDGGNIYFHGNNLTELYKHMKEAVDGHIENCDELKRSKK